MDLMKNTCCFIGHRKIEKTEYLENKLRIIIEKLIVDKGVRTFIFGSKSQFNDLCYDLVSKLKERYTTIERIYIRAEYPYIDENYRKYLLGFYEDTYYPDKMLNAGRALYVERNREMIDQSKYCIFYYKENRLSSKSGTKTAYNYAIQKDKTVINILKETQQKC